MGCEGQMFVLNFGRFLYGAGADLEVPVMSRDE